MCRIIEEFDVTPSEFWTACGYLTRLGQANEVGLLVPGLGIEHFLDLLMDEKERRAGLEGGTPRTIEGPALHRRRAAQQRRGAARPGSRARAGAVHGGAGQGHRRQARRGRDRGRVARQHARAATRISTRRRAPTICAAGSRRTARGATGSARSCPPATAARRTARRRNCCRRSGGTGSAPRISTSSSRRRASAS